MRIRYRATAATLALSFLSVGGFSVFAEQPGSDPTIQSLRADMAELIKGQLELQKQVGELKAMLQGNQACPQTPPPNIVFDVSGGPSEGEARAPVVVVEFSDFQCPFSARYTNETFPRLDQEYVRTGKVRYVFRNFPLDMHPLAHKLAECGECAAEQKHFWELRAQLFANQPAVTSEEAMFSLAQAAGVDVSALKACVHAGHHVGNIDQSRSQASGNGVTGTPTFFLGRNDPATNKIKILKVIIGHQPFETFKQAIDSIIAETKTPGSKI